MNKARRKELERAAELMNEARVIIENARDEEQDCYDNMPENIQGGERGEMMSEQIDGLTELVDGLESFDGDLASIIGA
jgi:hypothetical protein